jgi:hypothetical protein
MSKESADDCGNKEEKELSSISPFVGKALEIICES